MTHPARSTGSAFLGSLNGLVGATESEKARPVERADFDVLRVVEWGPKRHTGQLPGSTIGETARPTGSVPNSDLMGCHRASVGSEDTIVAITHEVVDSVHARKILRTIFESRAGREDLVDTELATSAWEATMRNSSISKGSTALISTFLVLGVAAHAVAGFNGDDYRDLVVASPNKDLNSQSYAGMVMEVDGSSAGITTEIHLWHQDAGLADVCEANDHLGRALAIGDFDGDGYFDLAIGVPQEDIGDETDAGGVSIIYGSSAGLFSSGDQFLTQDEVHSSTSVEASDQFGFALAAADFNGDGYDDLAMSAPLEDIGIVDIGEVVVVFGSADGIDPAGSQWILQPYFAEDNLFGARLAAGDFDHDGYADLAVGAPGTEAGGLTAAGVVEVYYGSGTWLVRRTGASRFHQDVLGIQNDCHAYDGFGYALAAGDVDGDGYDDLAVGVKGENFGDTLDVGIVHILSGTSDGLTGIASDLLSQSIFGGDSAEADDQFGASLAMGDFDGDGFADLAVGTPWEDVGVDDAGLVQLVYGSADGLDKDRYLTIWEDSLDNRASIQGGESFGYALAAGDIDNDGFDDLAIGAPWQDFGSAIDAGTAYVAYGAVTGLSMDNDFLDHCTPGYLSAGCDSDDLFGWALAIAPAPRAAGDSIFSDGFESGGLSGWSEHTP